jgi:hypothetical protein
MWEEPSSIIILLAREYRQESMVMGQQNQDPLIGIKFGQPFDCANALIEIEGVLLRWLEKRVFLSGMMSQ